MKLILATGNVDKIQEIKEILNGKNFEICSMYESGYFGDIPENGNTFEENALIKARAVHAFTGGYVVADDSGLCINALGGAPGIFSARFAGENTGYEIKIHKIWEMLAESGNSDRNASFICAIAVIRPDGSEFTVRGECHGIIYDKIEGRNGFGYDPIFYMPEFGMTTASMTREQKNLISHRAIALGKMADILSKEIV